MHNEKGTSNIGECWAHPFKVGVWLTTYKYGPPHMLYPVEFGRSSQTVRALLTRLVLLRPPDFF